MNTHPGETNSAKRQGPALERLVEIEESLRQLIRPGQTVELRALDVQLPGEPLHRVMRGYFRDPTELARAAVRLDGYSRGIYWTPNPLSPVVMERCPNRVEPAGKGDAASDADVIRRTRLLVDFDPIRPKDTNSTDDELAAAIRVTESVWLAMRQEGWPEPRAALSGNGVHLLYAVDLPAQDGGQVARVLHRLSRQFSTETVKIDTTCSNPARIWKLYGTTTAKGPDTPERPRRRSMLLGRERWAE